MKNSLRNLALQSAIAVLCGLIVLNGYFVSRNLKVIEQAAGRRGEASKLNAEVYGATLALQVMETSQRGYLLTGDESYLRPYNDAGERLTAHLAALRSNLIGKNRSLQDELEPVIAAKIADMQETIRLRQRGYRHRAFVIVSSNRGQEMMRQARSILDTLSAAQSANLELYDREMTGSMLRALAESTIASGILLVVALVTFLAFNRRRKRLETGNAFQAEELRTATGRLQQLTGTVFPQISKAASQIQAQANALLVVYGGFLPRQAQDKAERIEAGAAEISSLLDDAGHERPASPADEVVEVRAAEAVSA